MKIAFTIIGGLVILGAAFLGGKYYLSNYQPGKSLEELWIFACRNIYFMNTLNKAYPKCSLIER